MKNVHVDLRNIKQYIKQLKKSEKEVAVEASGSATGRFSKRPVSNIDKLRGIVKYYPNVMAAGRNKRLVKKVRNYYLKELKAGRLSGALIRIGEGIIIPTILNNWKKGYGADGRRFTKKLSRGYAKRKADSGRKPIPDMNLSGQLQLSLRTKKIR